MKYVPVGILAAALALAACGSALPTLTPTPSAAPVAALTDETIPTPTALPTETETPTPSPEPTAVPTGAPTPSVEPFTFEKNLTYCQAGQVDLKLDLYLPDDRARLAPALLYVHGGAWTGGDKEDRWRRLLLLLAGRGFVVAAANYRLAPQYPFPAQIEDIKCAVRFLRANAARFNLDSTRIGAFGGSAGGHLVALLGLADERAGFEVGQYLDQSSRVQAVVDLFGSGDLTSAQPASPGNNRLRNRVFPADERVRASPVTYVSADAPPFLIIHGDQDHIVPLAQSLELYDRLKAAGADARLIVVRNAGHGLVPVHGFRIEPTYPEIYELIAEFFEQKLAPVG